MENSDFEASKFLTTCLFQYLRSVLFDFYTIDELDQLPPNFDQRDKIVIKSYWDSIVKITFENQFQTGFFIRGQSKNRNFFDFFTFSFIF